MENREDYLKLVQEIQKHNQHYYIEYSPLISDYEYDLLYKKLEKMEKAHPEWVIPTSPTQRIGDPLTSGFQQVSHVSPMLSLANTYTRSEIEDFIKRVEKLLNKRSTSFCTELKVDGVAVSVRYERGIYVRALTRGDGKKGDNITLNMKTISSLPLELFASKKQISIPKVLEVRGEVFMPREVFEKQNQQRHLLGEDLWANPRNAAAGSLKLLDPQETAKRQLSVLFYGIAEISEPLIKTQYEVPSYLKTLGLPAFQSHQVRECSSLEEILEFAKIIEKTRSSFVFEIDGIVIKINSLEDMLKLGRTGKNPRGAVAYKFAPEQVKTRIKTITVQVGRSGVLTPVAELDPVFLAGSTISRATLHNEEDIIRKDIREGDWVFIEKAGDVIPQISQVVLADRAAGSKPWTMPIKCPSCGTKVIKTEGEVAIRCPNSKGCEEQKIRRIAYFVGKQALDVEHMGEKVIEQLVKKKIISDRVDIFNLKESDLFKIEGFQKKSVDNLLKSIDKARHISLPRLIVGLGIRYIGLETATVLAKNFDSIEKMFHVTIDQLLKIEGIGLKMAEAIVSYFQKGESLKEIAKLKEYGVCPEAIVISKSQHPFNGKTFVLTGTLQKFTRTEATNHIHKCGGVVTNSVSHKTDYLILGESPGSKLQKAQELGITCLSEQEFIALLE